MNENVASLNEFTNDALEDESERGCCTWNIVKWYLENLGWIQIDGESTVIGSASKRQTFAAAHNLHGDALVKPCVLT